MKKILIITLTTFLIIGKTFGQSFSLLSIAEYDIKLKNNPVSDYNNGDKWIFSISAVVGTFSVDMSDYMGITGEGQNGWVTCWLYFDAILGADIGCKSIKVHIKNDDLGGFINASVGLSTPGYTWLDWNVYDSGSGFGQIDGLQTSSLLNMNIGAGVSFKLLTFEMKKEELNEFFNHSLVPGYSILSFAMNVFDNKITNDNEYFGNILTREVRRTTVADEFTEIEMELRYKNLKVNDWGNIEVDVVPVLSDEYRVQVWEDSWLGLPTKIPEWTWANTTWNNSPVAGPQYIATNTKSTFYFPVKPTDAMGEFYFWLYKGDGILTPPVVIQTFGPIYTLDAIEDFTLPYISSVKFDELTNIITIDFSEDISTYTITPKTIQINEDTNYSYSWQNGTKRLLITPDLTFSPGQNIELFVSRFIQDKYGNRLAQDESYSFHVNLQGSLTNGNVTPQQGNTSTNFQFSAYFRGLQAPQYVRTIGSTGWSIDMSGSGNYSDGVLFTANKFFPIAGTYSYYYEAKTSTGQIIRYPESGNLTLNVTQSAEGWDLIVQPVPFTSYLPASVSPSTQITVSASVKNSSNSGNTYANVSLLAELFDPTGNKIAESPTTVIANLASGISTTYPLKLTMPSNAGNGSYQIVVTAFPLVDNIPSNNSATLGVVIGASGTNEQYEVTYSLTTIFLNDVVSINGNSFILTGINTSQKSATFQDPSGTKTTFFKLHNKVWNNYASTIAICAVSSSGAVNIKSGKSVTNGPVFDTKAITGYSGQTISFTATSPGSRPFDSFDTTNIFKPGTSNDVLTVRKWFSGVSTTNSDKNIAISFTIPANATLDNYLFYIATPYSDSNIPEEHLTRLEINVIAAPPQISNLSKDSFSADDQITISGTNFGTSQKTVRFYNNRDGIILGWTDTQIICKVPYGVQNGNVFVVNDNGPSNGLTYNVISSTGDPIVVQAIPYQSMSQNSSLVIANLNNVFSDPNNDALVFSATSSSLNIMPSIVSSNLILTSNSLATGSSQITVSAKDVDNVIVQSVFQVTIINPSPLIEVTPVSLVTFGNIQVGFNSLPQSYTVSGSNLSDNININAPSGFQVSLFSSTGFGNSLTLSPNGGTVSITSIYVIFSPNSNGTYSNGVTNTSTGANTQKVSVEGTGYSIPKITTNPTSLTFGNVLVNSNSSPQGYLVSGIFLTDNITITAPTGYQVSLSSSIGFGNTATLTQSGGTLPNIPIYVRFSPTYASGYSGNVINASPGAIVQNVTVTGTGISTPIAPIIGQITQPTCSVSTGSVVLSGLPTSETWALTSTPGGVIKSGTGTSAIITELPAGTYSFTVTNSSGYISPASEDVVIDAQPLTPSVTDQVTLITSGAQFTVTPVGVPDGTIYIWDTPSYTYGVTGGSAQTVPQTSISGVLTIPSGTGTATYTVTPVLGSCVGSTFTVTVTVTANTVIVPPTVTTGTTLHIAPTAATSGGMVTDDGGSTVIARGVCWSTSPNPTIDLLTKTSDGTGGGPFISYITGLSPSTTYYVRSYAINSAGPNYGGETIFKTYNSDAITDIEGNYYNIIKIGDQWWMAENLKTIKFNDGNSIPYVTDNTTWAIINSPAYCWYNNDSTSYKAIYGALYNYYAINTGKLCPTGWHVPSDAEWTNLTTYLGGETVAGGKLKETGYTYWASPNTGATNESGFTALPGGGRYMSTGASGPEGVFYDIGTRALWWSSTLPYLRLLWNDNIILDRLSFATANHGFSVRCIKEACLQAPPTLGQIIHPTCSVPTGGVVLDGLPGTGTWHLVSNPVGVDVLSTGVSYIVPELSPGSYTFTVTNSSGCTSSASADVNINTVPLPPSINGSFSICEGSTTQLTGSGTAADINPWVSGTTSVATVSSTGLVSGMSDGTSIITYTNNNGCSNTAIVTVTTNNTLTLTSGNDYQSVCLSMIIPNITYSTTGATGAIFNGLPPGVTGSWVNNVITISGAAMQPGFFSYVITLTGGCGSIAQAGTIYVEEFPYITGPSTLCQGSIVTLTTNPSLNGGIWTSNEPTIATVSNYGNPSVEVTGLTPGNATIIYTSTSGCSASVDITVNALPLVTFPGSLAAQCITSTTYALAGGTPGGGTYSGPGFTGTNFDASVAGIGTHTITYSYTNGSGCTATATNTIVVNKVPSVANQTTSIVSGGTFVVTPAGVPVGTTYTWTSPVYAGGVTGGSAQAVPQSSLSGSLTGTGTATYTVTPTSGTCTGASFTVTVTVTTECIPVTIGTQPSDNIMCETSGNASFTVVANNTAPFTYQWEYNNSGSWAAVANGTPAGASYTNATAATLIVSGITSAGSYQYRSVITNCSGANNTTSNVVTLTVNALPAVFITNPAVVCAPATVNLTDADVTVGSTAGLTFTYWTDAAATVLYDTPTTAPAGIYYIKGTAATGCFDINYVTVTYNPVPSVSNQTTSALSGVQFNFTPAGASLGTTYTWTAPTYSGGVTGGSSQASAQSDINGTLTGTGTATYTVTPTSGTCTGANFTVIVTVSTGCVAVNIMEQLLGITMCANYSNTSLFVVASGTGPFSYQWEYNNAGIWTAVANGTPAGASYIGANSATLNVAGITLAGDHQYRCYITNCNDVNNKTSDVVILTVYPTPLAPIIGTPTQPTCDVETGSVVLNGLPASGAWTITSTPAAVNYSGLGTSNMVSGLIPGLYTFTVANESECISPASGNVVINSQPVPPVVSNQTTSIVPGGTFVVTPSGVPAGTTYTWTTPSYTGGVTGGTAQGSPQTSITGTLTIPTGTGTAIYTITPASGLCTGTQFTLTVTVTTTLYTISTSAGAGGTISPSGNSLVSYGSTYSYTISPDPGYQIDYVMVDNVNLGAINNYTFSNISSNHEISATFSIIPSLNVNPPNQDVPFSTGTTNFAVTSNVAWTASSDQTWCTVTQSGTGNGTLTATYQENTGTNIRIATIIVFGSGVSNQIVTVTQSGLTSSKVYQLEYINGSNQTYSGGSIPLPIVFKIRNTTDNLYVTNLASENLSIIATASIGFQDAAFVNSDDYCGSGDNTCYAGYYFVPPNIGGAYVLSITIILKKDNLDVDEVTITENITSISGLDPPLVGTITDPTCNVATGSVVLNGLPSTGSWTLTRTPGEIISSGTGTSTTITGLEAGTYTFSLTNAAGATSGQSNNVIINPQPVTPNLVNQTIAALSGTPFTVIPVGVPVGTSYIWTAPNYIGSVSGGIAQDVPQSSISGSLTGSGTATYTVTPVSGSCSGTTFTLAVTVSSICDPVTVVTQPSYSSMCSVFGDASFAVVANGTSPYSYQWQYNNGGIWTNVSNGTPSGASYANSSTPTMSVSGISAAGSYQYRCSVRNCSPNPVTSNAAILTVSAPPSAPAAGPPTQTTCFVATGSVALSELPATGTWTLVSTPAAINYQGTGTGWTVPGLLPGTYSFTVTNAEGCTSPASGNVVINTQPVIPDAAGTITGPVTITPGNMGIVYSVDAIANATSYVWEYSGTGVSIIGTGNRVTLNFSLTATFGQLSVKGHSTCGDGVPSVKELTPVNYEIKFDVLNASGWFGGDNRTNSGPRDVGNGQSVFIDSTIILNNFSFYFTDRFDYSQSPDFHGHEVILNLNIRNSDGVIIHSEQIVVPQTFNGGWVTWSDIDLTVLAQSTLIFTCNLVGAYDTAQYYTGVGADLNAGYDGGVRYNKEGTSDSDMDVWTGWLVHEWDSNFWLQGTRISCDLSSPIVGEKILPTCELATGSVALSGLPATGTWTIVSTPAAVNHQGTGTGWTVPGLLPGTYTFIVTNAAGCTSQASGNVVINAAPEAPTAPILGTITQPTCELVTGSVVLGGLPTGNWTINPGAIAGTGASTTLSLLSAGTHNYSVTNAAGCVSTASGNVVINAAPGAPTAPTLGTITQPTCALATGSVVLGGLPTGNWTINPGAIAGTGTSTTLSLLSADTYNYTVTNAAGCTSPASGNVTIVSNPGTPSAPIVGTITQPTCVLRTGSAKLNGLPDGNWIINPGGIPGTGISTTITGLTAETYNFTVTNSTGCISEESSDVIINEANDGVIPKITTKYDNDLLLCYNLDSLFVSYQWYKDLEPIQQGGTMQYYQTHRIPATYYVITTDKNGCINSSNSIVIAGKKSMTVYPNPASYSFSLKLENFSDGRTVVVIFNSAGIKMKELHVESINDNLLKQIPINELDKGIYVVKVIVDNNESYYTKIVVIK